MQDSSMPGPEKGARKIKHENVIATNSSCIDSKRCVEKLYYKQDYGMLRYFVKKYRRRSALISRGYYVRMKAVKDAVQGFIQERTDERKVIVNLGCGYDPLPFQLIEEFGLLDPSVCFVDVDHDALILKKCEVVQSNIRLSQQLPDMVYSPSATNVKLRATNYAAIGCDLSDLPRLDNALRSILEPTKVSVLFLCEVSMIYMDTESADALIKWTSSFKKAQFFLLQQYLPDGDQHPFAETMLKHFSKLQSPLISIFPYPTLEHQRDRFRKLGWAQVETKSLWNLWNDDKFLSSDQRQALDQVEPFDEWEEFALYCGHYFCLHATTVAHLPEPGGVSNTGSPEGDTDKLQESHFELHAIMSPYPRGLGHRKSGAIVRLTNNHILHHGGYGYDGRLQTYDQYLRSNIVDMTKSVQDTAKHHLPSIEVMCHSIISLPESELMLIGGRTSPERASSACFLGCNPSEALPHGLFRHSAVCVERVMNVSPPSAAILVMGGKTGSGKVRDDWHCWESGKGWRSLEIIGERPPARFGASMARLDKQGCSGYLTGGIRQDGTIIQDFWTWRLVEYEGSAPSVQCEDVTKQLKVHKGAAEALFRFGAQLIPSPRDNGLILVGGIASNAILTISSEFLSISKDLEIYPCHLSGNGPRPLLVGFSAINTRNEILIAGGGAVCFSFGTCWNAGSYQISSFRKNQASWTILEERTGNPRLKLGGDSRFSNRPLTQQWVETVPLSLAPAQLPAFTIPRARIYSASEFERIVEHAKPVVLQSLDFGSCRQNWDLNYIRERIGETNVVVHRCSSPNLSFLAKNFEYITMSAREFLDRVQTGEHLYLRSISTTDPTSSATELGRDFPHLAKDFQVPAELVYAADNMHSSPLRISSKVHVSLHYDVLANILCQIRGEKRLVLFAPEEASKLKFPPGSSSSPLDVFNPRVSSEVSLGNAQRYEAELHEGDLLFIPPLWSHAAQPTQGLSIAVNVFFRNLEASAYAAGRDVYGNRDLQAYENGRRDVQRMLKAFHELPKDVTSFYLQRLADELTQNI